MTKLLLASYRIEFETTDITIDKLCFKHNLKTSDLKGYTSWSKREGIEQQAETTPEDTNATKQELEQLAIIDSITEQTTQTIIPTIVPTLQDSKKPTTITDKIVTFKEKAMDEALRFMETDVKFAEIKEFKDMVNIVDSIDKSFQKVDPNAGPTINILVQTLTERYKDDC